MTLRCSAFIVLLLALGPAPAVAAADTAPALYTRALARERVLRDAERNPALPQLRSIVSEYERIVRKFPRSGYCDNALWQGANVALLAFDRFGQPSDRRTAVRLLAQLKRHYPSSSLVARADDLLRDGDVVRASAAPSRSAPEAWPVVTAPEPSPVPPVAPARSSVTETRASSPVVSIRDIKRTPLPDGMRISIELDGESAYRSERLDGPARVFFDLKSTSAVPVLQDATLKFSDDLVREIRLGRHPQNTTRIVMDMAGIASYSVFTLYDPFRLVIDFKAAAVAAPAAPGPSAPVAPPVVPAATVPVASPPLPPLARTTPAPAPAPASPAVRGPVLDGSVGGPRVPEATAEIKLPARRAVPPALNPPALPSVNADGKFSLARQLGLGISRIVIDAGHGGHDPGSQANGLKEAELCLDVAQRLKRLLEKDTSIEVVMTRDTDVFIPLEERTVIANREGADLFLSIHANTARSVKAGGVETYFLSFASNPEAEAVAARENSTSGRTMHNLPDIVRAIALNNKLDESRDFADAVQRSMMQRLQARNKQLKDRGVKQAPFVVLIGAAMPSVLAEISFLTNKQEARLLKTGAYRQQVAEALLDAVLRYQQSVKKLRTVSTVGAR